MGNRRFAQVSTSDEDDDVPVVTTRTRRSEDSRQNKRKRIKLQGDEEEEEEKDGDRVRESKRERKGKDMERGSDKNRNQNVKEEEEQEEEEEEEQPQEDAKPVGEPLRVTGKGRGRRNHYEAFEFDGNRYELEDPVLLVPEDKKQKPYVAILKDISQNIKDGSMTVTGQWFYRPEEADRKGGGNWQSRDTRELFYSFHRDEIPAESVMHKCVVHFVPINKQLPNRKQHPGFIVQKVYDTVERKLWKLTDKDYEDNKQHEIDLLVQKTRARLGDLPDVEPEEAVTVVQDQAQQEDQSKTKRVLRKKNISPLDVTREEEVTTRSDQHHKAETPGSCTSNNSEYYAILTKFKALTGETHRDKWLERLLQGIQYMCYAPDSTNGDYKVEGGVDGLDHEKDNKRLGTTNGSQEKGQKSSKSFIWPDSAVPAVTALEKASHDALSLDFQKYNQKMRQLVFNLKATELLARRLLNGELEPSKMINMSPNELKDGLTAEEIAPKEPDELERMQMTDARCSRCNELKVGVRDIIQAGHGDRYKLECIGCGHNWYASRDEASRLTIDGPSSAKTVGTVPLATTKFESLEKKLLSPRSGDDKSGVDVLKKSSEAYMPVLEAQRSFGKTKNEENPESTKKEE